MLELKRKHQIPSLSVHDSLIVPAHNAETARTLLVEKFQDHRGVAPLLKINWSRLPNIPAENPGGTQREPRERERGGGWLRRKKLTRGRTGTLGNVLVLGMGKLHPGMRPGMSARIAGRLESRRRKVNINVG